MLVVCGSGPTAVCAAGRCVLTVVVFRGRLNLELVCLSEAQRTEDFLLQSVLLQFFFQLSESESVVLRVALLVCSLVVKAVI